MEFVFTSTSLSRRQCTRAVVIALALLDDTAGWDDTGHPPLNVIVTVLDLLNVHWRFLPTGEVPAFFNKEGGLVLHSFGGIGLHNMMRVDDADGRTALRTRVSGRGRDQVVFLGPAFRGSDLGCLPPLTLVFAPKKNTFSEYLILLSSREGKTLSAAELRGEETVSVQVTPEGIRFGSVLHSSFSPDWKSTIRPEDELALGVYVFAPYQEGVDEDIRIE